MKIQEKVEHAKHLLEQSSTCLSEISADLDIESYIVSDMLEAISEAEEDINEAVLKLDSVNALVAEFKDSLNNLADKL